MAEFVTVAKTADIPAGQAKTVDVNGTPVAVFNVGGTYYAIEDTCSHTGGPLSEGAVEGTTVSCPWHGAQFDLATGQALTPPASVGVKPFKVRVQGDQVQLGV